MTNYLQMERDFIERTLKIIDQYEELVRPNLPPNDQFEVTLLMNCLLGLLVYPQQIAANRDMQKPFDRWLTNDFVAAVGHEWGIYRDYVLRAGYKREDERWIKIEWQQLTVRNLVRQMRNAVAHASFRVDDTTHQIDAIWFEDKENKDGFLLKLPVVELEHFTRKLASSALEKLPQT